MNQAATYVPTNPLIVQSDKTVLLETANARFEEARDALSLFTELVKSPEHIHTYRITPLSLWNAAALGLRPEQVKETLLSLSKFALPQNVLADVDELMGRYGRLKLIESGDAMWLVTDDDALLEEVVRQRKIARLLIGGIQDDRVRVRPEERGELKHALIQLGFPLAVQATLALQLPAWPFALALLLCLLVFGAVFRSRVPLWLSGRRVQRSLCARLPAHIRHVVDLGAGTGGIVLAVARARPEARVLGIEWALLPWLFGQARLALAGYRGSWRWGSLWEADLRGVDLAYAYLSPAAMPQLWGKACAEMPRGSLLVSYRFAIPGVPADMTWPVEGQRDRDDVLYVWRLPGAQTTG